MNTFLMLLDRIRENKMNSTTATEGEKQDQTSPQETKSKSRSPEEDEEFPSVQQHEAKPSGEPHSSGSYKEADRLEQSANMPQNKSSPRVSFAREDQNSERGRSFRQLQHHHHDSTSSSPSSSSPPLEAERSTYQPNDATRSSQDNSQSHGCHHRGVPTHQLMSGPPRDHNFALGQLAAAAGYNMATDSPNYHNDIEGRKRLHVEENDEDMGWRKKQKVKGKGKQAERWDVMFDRLVQFQQEHGHCLVPNRYPEDPSLGAWVSTQRRHYKILMTGRTDQTTPMTEERASRLESIGFAWETSDPRHVPWETRFEQLLEYKERFGDCVVPIGWKENPRLSNWVSAQRQEYKLFRQGKKARITPERILLLDSVGFVWEAQRGNNKKKRTSSKKRVLKLGPSIAEEGLSVDGNNAVANMIARQAFERIIPPPNTLRPDIPPAFLSHVLSLGSTQQQSNGPQTEQREALEAAAAARMMEDVVALQSRNPMLRAPTAHFSPALLPGAAHPPLQFQDIAQSVASPNHASSQLERLAFADCFARQLQERRESIAATTNDLNASYEEQIITKHLLQALQQGGGIDSMEVLTAVQKIRGLIGLRDDSATARPFPMMNDAPRREHHQMQQTLRPPYRLHPPVDTRLLPVRNESETEASRFGVALQMGEVVRPSGSHPTNVRISDGALTAAASALKGTVGMDLSPPSWEDCKLPVRRDIGRSSLSTYGEWNSASTPGNASDVPRSPQNKDTSRVAKSSSSGGSQTDDEGVFSDAEEDETATAFLTAAMGSARR